MYESGDVERLDLRELVKVVGGAPVGEAAGGVHIGPSRMSVVDLCREKLEEASRAFRVGAKSGAGRRSSEGAIISSFMPSPAVFISV
jgi:hypothetical protein